MFRNMPAGGGLVHLIIQVKHVRHPFKPARSPQATPLVHPQPWHWQLTAEEVSHKSVGTLPWQRGVSLLLLCDSP